MKDVARGVTSTPVPPPVKLRLSPHGAQINAVAVLDTGDAAITSDDLGDLRLWPSLDGKREPVVLPANGHPQHLALGLAGGRLLAVTLDAAGIASILRMSRDGAPDGRTQLAGEQPVVQAVVAGGVVLVRRVDHTLDIFEASGALRATLVPPPGERLVEIVVRRDTVIALMGDDAPRTVRWIELGNESGTKPSWGKSVTLPVPAKHVALSPGHKRIAEESALDHKVTVFDVDGMKAIGTVDPGPATAVVGDASLGFVDDGHLAVDRGGLQWWVETPPTATGKPDPWKTPPNAAKQQPMVPRGGLDDIETEIADNVVVTGARTALAITANGDTKYLGYRDVPDMRLWAAGTRLASVFDGRRILWFDDDLAQVAAFDMPDTIQSSVVQPAGDKHVLLQQYGDGMKVEVMDVDKPTEAPILVGEFAAAERVDIQGEVVLVTQGTTTDRYLLDWTKRTATKQGALATSNATSMVLTPERKDGVVAVGVALSDDGYRLVTYRETGKPGATLSPKMGSVVPGYVFAFDRMGRAYLYATSGEGGYQVVDPDGTVVEKHDVPGSSTRGAVSADGARIAFLGTQEVIGVEGGKVIWKVPMWQPGTMTFSPDGKRLVIGTPGGYVVLDAATGQRTQKTCAWGFGLWAKEPSMRFFNQTPVCAEPE